MGDTGLTAEKEQALLTALRAGSAGNRRAAAEALLIALEPKVLELCLHVTGDPDAARDAAQEALISIHRGVAGFRGQSRLSTWAYQIALRSALAARRRPRRRPEEGPSEEEPFQEPVGEIEARDRWRALVRAMARLPAEQRAVLSLFAVDGLSHAEVAAVLGVPEGTIWSRLHAARKRLREALAEPQTG
jgi:RNA polymerase sigma-70 factor (ECF subfamily)